MNRIHFHTLILFLLAFGLTACKDQLDVGNPNAPTVAGNVTDESGLVSFAQGAVYINGFVNGDGWLGNSYFSLPYGYSELLGDVVGAQASNQLVSTLSIPDYVTLDNGQKLTNSSPSIGQIRANNTRAQTGSGYNPTYYQWLNMMAMNSSLNSVLKLIDKISYSGDAASKVATFKAWAYFWKGYAYASIGSMYYAGLIIDEEGKTSSEYVTHDAIIERSNYYLNEAATALGAVKTTADYEEVLGRLIPSFSQVGNGGVLTTDMWKRNINTLLARNILVNKLAPFVNKNPSATITKSSTTAMSTADWNAVLTLATNGIKKGDYVFTGRSTSSNYLFSASGGTVASLTTGTNTSSTFKLSERFVQNFKTGDKRLTNNFEQTGTYLDEMTFGTRWSIVDGGKGAAGVYVYGNRTVGAYELYIAGSYEENALMLAEANIRLGKISTGLAYLDDVRSYQGAGIATVADKNLVLADALQELVQERRVALVFRGLSFYDSRRWGWTYDIANGGGSYNNTVLSSSGTVNTKAVINYNFLDYWDIPADESSLNPTTSSVPTKNPNF